MWRPRHECVHFSSVTWQVHALTFSCYGDHSCEELAVATGKRDRSINN